ncbi:MAG: DUF692 family protein [Candidatus Schekmanbacteria bacterium]|nr:DUF692 family protein [Candidatus Schekmanbacteria bacterium]
MADSFFERIQRIPALGVGISTEYGAGETPGAVDVLRLQREYPDLLSFLEIGVETAKGLDPDAEAWLRAGLPTTYHFLDINLDDPTDFTTAWLAAVRALVRRIRPAYLCGDAGMWHFGPRDRGHMLLLPPILCAASAFDMAQGIRALRTDSGLEVFPENPPGHVFLGDLHLLEYFRIVLEEADTGMLLDCAHLAIYQQLAGMDALAGLARFPLDRVVEMHVAGGSGREHDGLRYVDDDHTPNVLPDTWRIFEHVVERAPNLKAVVFECERNAIESVLPGFRRLADAVSRSPARSCRR